MRTKICAKEYKIAESQSLQDVLFPKCSTLKEDKNCIKLGVNEPRTPKPQKPALNKGWYSYSETYSVCLEIQCQVT